MDGVPVLAGVVSTAVFAGSVLPMLHKAMRTRDLSSYSLGNIVLANVGNAVHSVYVFHLPAGPIWFLHSFYVVSSALMLFWYLRCRTFRGDVPPPGLSPVPAACDPPCSAPERLTHRRPMGAVPTVKPWDCASVH